MTPDDPRHGSTAGYRAGCRVQCCRRAISRYNEARKLRGSRGEPTSNLVPAIGTQRRIKALVALGWSIRQIGLRIDIDPAHLRTILSSNSRVSTSTAKKVAALYDELSMTPPQGQAATRARNHALARGWAPPLAWDDIDNDPSPRRAHKRGPKRDEIDEAMVLRVIDGGPRPRRLTPAEAAESVRRLLARGVSTKQIEENYGIKPERYVRIGDAA